MTGSSRGRQRAEWRPLTGAGGVKRKSRKQAGRGKALLGRIFVLFRAPERLGPVILHRPIRHGVGIAAREARACAALSRWLYMCAQLSRTRGEADRRSKSYQTPAFMPRMRRIGEALWP